MGSNAPGLISGATDKIEPYQSRSGRGGLLATGGLLAALGVSSCCVLPVLFMSLGLGGAWLGHLYALSAYQPVFIVLSVGFLGAGFYYLYRKPKARYKEGSSCATPTSSQFVKGVLWGATALVIAGIVFPYAGQYFLDM